MGKYLKIFKTKFFYFILLTTIVFLLYGKSINYDFVSLDEDSLIVSKIQHLSNIKNIPNFFLTSCYFTKTSSYYRPILTLSFSLEASLFGLNTKIYHLTNIILFILALYLMYIFLLKLNLNKFIIKSLILLMAVHPVFATLPVWIPGRNDTLLTIFIILSFIKLKDYIESNDISSYIFFNLFFVLSLFTKETAVSLIILYPLFIYCFKYNLTKKQVLSVCISLSVSFVFYLYLRSISVASINIGNYFLNIVQYLKNIILGISYHILYFVFPVNIPTLLFNDVIKLQNVIIDIFSFLFLCMFYYKNIKYRKIILFSFVWFIVFCCQLFFKKNMFF